MKYLNKTAPTRRTLMILAVLAPLVHLHGDTLTYEGFDIPPGEVDNTMGETSWGWAKILGIYDRTWWGWDQVNNDFFHAVSDGGLEYPGLPSKGNAFEFTLETPNGNNNQVYREMNKFYSYASTGQLWFSAIVQPKIVGEPTGYGWFQVCLSSFHNAVYFGVSNADDQTVWSGGGERLYIRTDENPDGIQGAKWAYSEVPIEDGVTAFLVMHLDFDNKLAHFYVNPPVDAEDPGEPVADFVMLTDLFVDKVMMWISNNGPSAAGEGADYIGTLVDEIRLGDTYASVAAGADLTDPGSGEVDTDPPVITGPSGDPGAATSAVSIPENIVRAATMEADETVTWSLAGGTDASFFTIGSGTGGLSFKEFADYENPLDADANNEYVVTVQAMDEAGNTSTQDVLVTVTDIVDETPPVISGLSGAAGDPETSATVNEGSLLVGTYSADKTVTWDLSGGADEAFFQIGENTGELSFLAAPAYAVPADADGNNVYEVEVRARDEFLNSAVQLVYVTVLEGQQVVTWGFWEPDPSGWIDTNASGGLFLGWINMTFEPYVWVIALNKYIYLPEEFIAESGSWSYTFAFLDEENPAPGDWGYWAKAELDWVDTTPGFLGWVNVYDNPWVFCQSTGSYLYLPQENLTPSGAWLYYLLTLPSAQ